MSRRMSAFRTPDVGELDRLEGRAVDDDMGCCRKAEFSSEKWGVRAVSSELVRRGPGEKYERHQRMILDG